MLNNLVCISILPSTSNHSAISSTDGNGSPPKTKHLNVDEDDTSRFWMASVGNRRNNDGVICIIVTEFISNDDNSNCVDSLISLDTISIVAPLKSPNKKSTTKGSNVGGDEI